MVPLHQPLSFVYLSPFIYKGHMESYDIICEKSKIIKLQNGPTIDLSNFQSWQQLFWYYQARLQMAHWLVLFIFLFFFSFICSFSFLFFFFNSLTVSFSQEEENQYRLVNNMVNSMLGFLSYSDFVPLMEIYFAYRECSETSHWSPPLVFHFYEAEMESE